MITSVRYLDDNLAS